MTEVQKPVQIAVNVMRARLTVVGFNLAIIAFQLSVLPRVPGAIHLPDLATPVHLETIVMLLMGLGLSITSLVMFISSCELDKVGNCTNWSLLAGDLLMYLGLAQSAAAFFGPMTHLFDQVTLNIPLQAAELATVRSALVITGAMAWFATLYGGPVVSLIRSPFSKLTTATLGVCYLVILLFTAHVSAQAVRLEVARGGLESQSTVTLFTELVKPLRW